MTTNAKAIVEAAIAALNAGDGEAFMATLADDIAWQFFGSHRFAGTFTGKQALGEGLFAVVDATMIDGLKVEVRKIIADGDCVVVEAKGDARSKAGLDYNNDYCLVFEVTNGKISRAREYLDSELVTRVFGPA
ncbi:MAG: nuclear transport factor 2 family protein [Gammaproteobacteria bacterium]|nr:nuclear transport factor 2 family protein [Gammaproteobacteria bacterium]